MKLVVFQVDVVNHLPQLAQAFAVAQAKSLDQGFEGAILTMMSELCAKHVEGNAVLDHLAFSHKIEARVLIDELFDQPGGSQAVDVNVPPRYPTTTLIILYPQGIAPGWSGSPDDWRLGDAQKFLATFVS